MTPKGQVDHLVAQAQEAAAQGRIGEAESAFRAAAEAAPDDADVKLRFAIFLANQGRNKESAVLLEQSLTLQPNSVETLNWLSMVQRNQGELHRSLEAARRALAIDPASPTAQFNAGLSLLNLGQAAEALAHFSAALSLRPNYPNYLYHFGLAAANLGRKAEARAAFENAVGGAPDFVPALIALANLCYEAREWERVVELSENAIRLNKALFEPYLLKGSALIELMKLEPAREALAQAIRIAPSSSRAYGALARSYLSEGKFDTVIAVAEQGLVQNPASGTLYSLLFDAKKATEEDRSLLEKMAKTAAEADAGRISVPPRELYDLHFAIAKASNDLGDYERSMREYDAAHRVRRRQAPFDRAEFQAARDRIISTFDAEFFAANRGIGLKSEMPLFIVGMMRSGTTLMEQLLSSHPGVGAAGEQPFWVRNAENLLESGSFRLSAEKVRQLGAEYLQILEEIAPGKKRVTDKNPGNIVIAGPIHAVFPNARIVHMTRHPIDTCLSIYMIRDAGFPWMHSKEDIVFAYEQYVRIANHWREVLPSDRYIEISYEQLVEDRETVLRRLLPFCGLDWSDACLEHETNERVVLTPSNWQVRQPIYRSSLARWRRYEPWLGAFTELFKYAPPSGSEQADSAH